MGKDAALVQFAHGQVDGCGAHAKFRQGAVDGIRAVHDGVFQRFRLPAGASSSGCCSIVISSVLRKKAPGRKRALRDLMWGCCRGRASGPRVCQSTAFHGELRPQCPTARLRRPTGLNAVLVVLVGRLGVEVLAGNISAGVAGDEEVVPSLIYSSSGFSAASMADPGRRWGPLAGR